jgi:hypothetical protein
LIILSVGFEEEEKKKKKLSKKWKLEKIVNN